MPRYCVYIRGGEAVGVITPSFLRASPSLLLGPSWKFRAGATRAEDDRQSDEEEEEEDRNRGMVHRKSREGGREERAPSAEVTAHRANLAVR